MVCGGLNKIVSHRPIVNNPVQRYGIIEGSKSLGLALRSQMLHPGLVFQSLLSS